MASNATMRRRSAPITDLYDSACELLYAAQQVRATAAERGATPAFAATIGCIDAALSALAEAVAEMRRTAAADLSATSDSDTVPALVVEREFAALADALRVAQAVCDQTRERTAPALARLSLG